MTSNSLFVAFVLGAANCACANVQPWERGNLAKAVMATDAMPLQSSLRQHDYASREAAGAASSGAAGGGCGCN